MGKVGQKLTKTVQRDRERFVVRLILVVVVFLLGVSSWLLIRAQDALSETAVYVGQTLVKAEVADTDATREIGLSGRKSLAKEKGMLFVFPEAGNWGIWMKDMKFDIDIIWIGDDKKVVHVVDNATPGSYPTIFQAPSPSRYVLEVPSDFIERTGVGPGTPTSF